MAVTTPAPTATPRTAILRSRFHGMFSNYAMPLTFTGRQTAKTCGTPVGYIADGDTLTVFSPTNWCKNVRAAERRCLWC